MRFSAVFLVVASLFTTSALRAQLDVPRIGVVRGAGGEVRAVTGVSSAFVVATEGVGLNAVAGEYSGRAGLWQTADRLVLTAADGSEIGSRPAAGGAVVIAFPAAGGTGVVWLAASGELLRFPGWQPLDVPDWGGDPVALAVTRTRLSAVVRRGDALWLVESSLSDGRVTRARLLPGVAAPVLMENDGTLIYAQDDAVVVSGRDGTEQRCPVTARPSSLERMGDGWIAVCVNSSLYALRRQTMDLLRLPGARREQ